jgi:phosphatidylglycerophosphate synthase
MRKAMAERDDSGGLTEGERWARAELQALLARRFSPPAVARFLWRSQQRTNEIRRRHPALGRQAWTWMAIGAAAWGGLAAGGAQPFRRRVRAGLTWWALTTLMLDWHLGMIESEEGAPVLLGPADALTLLRVWLVPVAADTPSAGVVALAGITDVLDGRVARATRTTRLGRDLEGLADACFAAAALSGSVRRERISRVAVSAELARLGLGFAYALLTYFGRVRAPDARLTRAARLTTPVRVSGIVAGGLGLRRTADALIAGGCAWSVAIVARALRRPGGVPRSG